MPQILFKAFLHTSYCFNHMYTSKYKIFFFSRGIFLSYKKESLLRNMFYTFFYNIFQTYQNQKEIFASFLVTE